MYKVLKTPKYPIVYSNLILLPSAHHRKVEVRFEQDFIFDEARKGERG